MCMLLVLFWDDDDDDDIITITILEQINTDVGGAIQ
jgi:hypothetical protein